MTKTSQSDETILSPQWQRTLGVTVSVILLSFAISRSGVPPALVVFLDNLHWTVAYTAGAWFAWLGYRAAAPVDRAARRWFAWALSAYAFGQILWDVQVAVGWNPFPGPSDFFYSCLGPGCALGLWSYARTRMNQGQLRTVGLDAGALTVAVLTVVVALYLPRRGDMDVLSLVVLLGYPVTLLGALCLGVVLILSLQPRLDRSWWVFLAALVVDGALWMCWNSLTLDHALQDGTWFNLCFSLAAVALGVGAMGWRTDGPSQPGWGRFCSGGLRLLPLLLVVIAATSLVIVWTLPNVPAVARHAVGMGVVVVVILAVYRQSMQLSDHDRLRAAEQRTQETAGQFRTLFETAHDAIFIMNARVFTDCNSSTLRMFGCTREQIIGHSPVKFSPELQPDGRRSLDKAPEKIAAAMSGQPQVFEWKHRQFDGTLFDAEVSLNRIEMGGSVLLQAMVRDVSERNRTERDLRESEERYRRIVETAGEGIWMIDPQARTSFVNPKMAQMLGYTVEEMQGRSLLDFIDEEWRTKAESNVARRKQGISEHHDFKFVRKDGSALWGALATSPITDAAGAYAGALAMVTDITERKHTVEALRQSEARMRRLVDSNLQGVIFTDTQGNVTLANDAFLKMTGYTREDLRAGLINWSRMTPPEYEHLDRQAVQELKTRGICTPWEKEYVRKDGSRIQVYVGVATFEGRSDEGVAFVIDISERKRAEQVLREYVAKQQGILRAAPVGIGVSVKREFVEVNDTLCEILGYPREELLGRELRFLYVSDEEYRRIGQEYRQLDTQNRGTVETQYVHKDGRVLDVIVTAVRIDAAQPAAGVIFTVSDITERKRAEQTARLGSAALAAAANAICITDRTGTIEWVNPAFTKFYGYTAAEALGQNARLVNSGVHDRPFFAALWQTILGGRVWHGQITNRHKDGHLCLSEQTISPVFSAEGGISHFVGVLQDVTERNRAEEALRRSREQFIDLFDNAPVGYHEIDAEGRFTRINRTELRMLGYADEELLGRFAWQITADEAGSREAVLAKLAGRQSAALMLERSFRRKNGTLFPVLIEDQILRGGDGRISGIRSVVQDITERKRAEEKAQHLANFPELNPNPVLEFTAEGTLIYHNPAALSMAQLVGFSNLSDLLPPQTKQIVAGCLATGQPLMRLETRHGEHTLSWSFYPISAQQVVHCYVGDISKRLQLEEQFRQAQKMEAIGQLSGGVAHDFNNLLTVILGNLGLLQSEGTVAPEVAEPLQAIGHAANRAANLTRQLLAFSRQQVMQQENLDLNAVVGHISKMLRRVIGEAVKIRLDYAMQALPIHADQGMLEQVILNLCINARDAMPQGGQLTLRTATVDISPEEVRLMVAARSGSFATMIVTDTGTGIAPENMKRVFEPFFTTKEVGKGTGLGLASVYGIAQQHDGWVTVESEVGRGTTFTVFLPLLAAPIRTDVAAPRIETLERGTETILLVEDDLAVQTVARITLQRLGYQVLVASNGHQALRVWAEHKAGIQLVLTDMIMPEGLSGSDIARQFKSDLPGIKIIFMSGYSADIAGTDFAPKDGDLFIGKPFEMHVLATIIRRSLDTVGGA